MRPHLSVRKAAHLDQKGVDEGDAAASQMRGIGVELRPEIDHDRNTPRVFLIRNGPRKFIVAFIDPSLERGGIKTSSGHGELAYSLIVNSRQRTR